MGHFYDKEGNPVYEVPCSTKQGIRDTTIKDARKLGLVPGVTEVIDMAAKKGLVIWQINQVLDAAYNLRLINIEEKQWKGMVRKKSEEITKNSSEFGTLIHTAIEKYFREQGLEDFHPLVEFVDPTIEKIDFLLKDIDSVIPEKSFYCPLGFGGKVDLHGKNFILDFKTKDKEFTERDELAYDAHCMQLAAYRAGLDIPNAKCYNLFISTKKPGLVRLHSWSEEEIQRGWEMFKCLLRYWQLVNNI